MGSVREIEQAIQMLPPAAKLEFRHWYAEFDAAEWDAEMEADAAAGKLDGLADAALAEHRAGRTREI